ncbi:Glucan endo-1,3-beta-glucosidase [Thalictrum thalictroides]|uniref:Glucan endo-1,3-beta-glucosidase n=1 Tax=Thalictrum thalictroides TaxID=46969 RepID=A0A7J6XD01_THATH|nr:Glucan endo-1,3-beta-glucosidase [Thalictrum thalictroides]
MYMKSFRFNTITFRVGYLASGIKFLGYVDPLLSAILNCFSFLSVFDLREDIGINLTMALLRSLFFVCTFLVELFVAKGLGINWGTRATHPLPGSIVVELLKDNGFDKVKLFEPDSDALKSLGNSGIQVMVGIPNEFLLPLSNSVQAAVDWVRQNVSTYISRYGVDIRCVAVGNEPFLKTYKGAFQQTTFPALQNIQAALIKAGLGRQVKVTVPLNADVYETDTNLPSGGDFRSDIHSLMISIIKFLSDNACPLTINIYPFLSLYADSHFPIDYAFFPGSGTASASPVVDGPITYSNVFDANYDTLIWALEKNGFSSIPVIIGEIGWPTDGDPNANINYARRFNQGLVDRIIQRQGSPKRASPPEIFIFGLIDEDHKSIDPGNFERHWGLFKFDGTVKYQLNGIGKGGGGGLVPAKGVKYMARQWCVMKAEGNLLDPNLGQSINYACTYADCTSMGYGSSCGRLDARSNASYAFNMYYQTANQQKGSCGLNSNVSAIITTIDPSQDTCKFEIMIDIGNHQAPAPPRRTTPSPSMSSSSSTTQSVMAVILIWIAGVVISVVQ